MEIVQTSEEINQINTALGHCSQLKTHITGALLHIQRLNAKYNETDYMAVIRNMESYRSNLSSTPYERKNRRGNDLNSMDLNNENICITPVKTIKRANIRRRIIQSKKFMNASTDQLNITSNSTNGDDESTPKRSMHELKRNNNTITVRTLKVQRNIESILTHLQVMQKQQNRNKRHLLERSLYQNCCNTSCDSPGQLGHAHCLESSFNSVNSSNYSNDSMLTPTKKRWTIYDQQQATLQKVQRFYATPLEKMHKRLINLNASLVSSIC